MAHRWPRTHSTVVLILNLGQTRALPSHDRDYGNLATIGRNSAVVDLTSPAGPVRFSGYFAWLFWLFAHVYFLIGFRNRLVVLLDWAWAYWSFARYARVVTGIEGPAGGEKPALVPRDSAG